MRYAFKKNQSGFTLIELMIVVAIVGILAVLAVYGVRKYLANAKTAEARNSLGQLSKNAVMAFEKEGMPGTVLAVDTAAAPSRQLCPSEPSPGTVPGTLTNIGGKKYQTGPAEWNVGNSTNAGFFCLHFTMDQPQYYAYGYTAVQSTSNSTGSFHAFANGDLNGDATYSTFSIDGAVQQGALNVAPNITEALPDE